MSMINILAYDGISESVIQLFEKEGFEVITTKVAQEQLENYINKNNITVGVKFFVLFTGPSPNNEI